MGVIHFFTTSRGLLPLTPTFMYQTLTEGLRGPDLSSGAPGARMAEAESGSVGAGR